ncbi:hypothetical protein HYV81_00225 [Candidatus Woesearchaeota archaeon]|nr:hypothetical protein [Candidatus Woesearchaeota archaeon]
MKDLVADSSFYLCFLEDICSPSDLVAIIDNFRAHLTPLIHKEIKRSINFSSIDQHANINIFSTPSFNIGELVKPFFSKKEISKGEHEIVVAAYFIYNTNRDIIIIIDEKGPRQFIINHLPELIPFLTGTVGMVGSCYYTFAIMDKQKTLNLLDQIGSSRFRVTQKILNEIKEKVVNHRD